MKVGEDKTTTIPGTVEDEDTTISGTLLFNPHSPGKKFKNFFVMGIQGRGQFDFFLSLLLEIRLSNININISILFKQCKK